MTVRAVGFVGL